MSKYLRVFTDEVGPQAHWTSDPAYSLSVMGYPSISPPTGLEAAQWRPQTLCEMNVRGSTHPTSSLAKSGTALLFPSAWASSLSEPSPNFPKGQGLGKLHLPGALAYLKDNPPSRPRPPARYNP